MMYQKKDIFDRIMDWKIFDFIRPFYVKNKEMLLYLFFGGLSFIVSVLTYALFNISFEMGAVVANIWSWIITVMFAFLTNRIWVFAAPTETIVDFFKQMFSFYTGRVITLIIEEAILYVFIDLLDGNSIVVKIIAQIIVIVLNYIISKLLIFKKDEESA